MFSFSFFLAHFLSLTQETVGAVRMRTGASCCACDPVKWDGAIIQILSGTRIGRSDLFCEHRCVFRSVANRPVCRGEHRSIVGVLWGQTPISQEQSGIIPGEAGSERGTNAGLFAARSSFPKMSNVGMSHVRSQMEREGSSLDILSRAFFNRPELTSRICKNSPPWQRRGGTRHQVNGPVPLEARREA